MTKVDNRRWVYQALDGAPFSLVIKKSSRSVIRDQSGHVLDDVPVKAIYLIFNKPAIGPARAVVDQALSDRHGIAAEDLVKLVEVQSGFNKTFFCVESPETKLEDRVDTAKHGGADGPKVHHGVRASRG